MVFLITSIICFFSANIHAQVIQKKADKWQLINGVKLGSGTQKVNLIKIQATTVSPSVNSQNTANISKKDKNLKPLKVLKYGNKRSSNSIKKEDDE